MAKKQRADYRGISKEARSARRRHNAGKRKFSVLPVFVLVLMLAGCGAVGAFAMNALNAGTQVLEGQEIRVTVPEGAGAGQIGQLLEEAQVIASASEFTNEVQSQDVANQLQPGTYKIVGGTDLDDIVTKLVNGDTDTVKLTIPEGWTVKQISKRVAKVTGLKAKDFRNACKHAEVYEEEFPFLNAAYKGTLEGFLFPDTYQVPKDASVDDVIKMMVKRYSDVMDDISLKYAKKKNLTAYDVTILASIVQQESASEKDMKSISAVFYNRLHENMSLGSDVTTYYAVGKDFSEELTQEDLDSDSPYNTRNRYSRGLPPGPICNPGKAALKAAAKPKKSKYLYFFYSNSEEKTYYYDNLYEFNSGWWEHGDGGTNNDFGEDE